MATRLENITNSNPTAPANSAFISAVFQEAYGRKPTANEIKRFQGQSVKDVSNIVMGASKSPFYQVDNGTSDINAIIGAVDVQTPEQLQQQAQQLYDPYFQQQETNFTNDYNTTLGRTNQDYTIANEQRLMDQQAAAGQAMGAYTQRFDSTFGSPLQQKLEAERMKQQGLQDQNFNNAFQRRTYDLGEVLRKQKEQNTYNRQAAIGNYLTSPQFQFSGVLGE